MPGSSDCACKSEKLVCGGGRPLAFLGGNQHLCSLTDGLLRTMSYQPGIRMPPFCAPSIRPVLQCFVFWGEGVGNGTYDSNWNRRRIWEDELYFLELLSSAPVLC